MLMCINAKNQLTNMYFGSKNRHSHVTTFVRDIKGTDILYILDLDDGVVEEIEARELFWLAERGSLDLPYGLSITGSGGRGKHLMASVSASFSNIALDDLKLDSYNIVCNQNKYYLSRDNKSIFEVSMNFGLAVDKFIVCINGEPLTFNAGSSVFQGAIGFEWYYTYKKGNLFISRFVIYDSNYTSSVTIIVKNDTIVGIDIVDCEKIKLVSYSESLKSLLNNSYVTKLKVLKLKY